ncbi:translocation/assembly module TamB domain-containing protein [Sulfitobacter sp. S190]|uniref:translocation/assembly module TamB domain-containing protein n=1 Tax=Sulfitobacter sp. S190 TaxID=2867022 RepID=UPI0021A7C6ED|nr:translocation/assembly module TamB domain-containing protein [Sulfitobacter sp. S190]
MRILTSFLLVLSLLAIPAHAQQEEEDKGFLTRKIQELLSGAGRDVNISGFRGALSSEASFDRMTIADADGVWLTLEDVRLDWNRSALLRGRLEVEELSAARIDIPRLPQGDPDTLPDAEATPFTFPQLPDLPVAIDIEQVSIAEVILGAPLVGEPVQMQLSATAQLNDEGLNADFNASRTDGKRGQFDIEISLSRDENAIDLLVNLSEGAEGIIGTLANIPGNPSVDLTIAGTGELDDLTTDITLTTDGEERLGGDIRVVTQGDADTPDRRIIADIDGDLTAIVLPQYRDFFGTEVSLEADALLAASGAVELSTLDLQAAAVDLQGRVRLADDKWPSFIDLEGTIARADGAPVLLPGGGGETTLERVVLDVDYDIEQGEAYEAVFDITGLSTSAATIGQTTLRSTGTLAGANGAVGQIRGRVNFAALDLALTDPALAEAIGSRIEGTTDINYLTDQPFRITNLDLGGTDYRLAGDVAISGVGEGLTTDLDVRLQADDLSRFSALAGRELDGSTALTLKGQVTPLSGEFNLDAAGEATGIATGIAQADALLEGRTDLTLTAIRNENGTFLRGVELSNAALLFTGEAALATDNSRVDADIVLRDIGTVLPQYEGRVQITGNAVQNAAGWRVDVDGSGPYDVTLSLDGLATGPDAALDFAAQVPRLSAFADTIEGALNAKGSIRQTPQGWLVQADATGPYGADARVNGLVTPQVDIGFDLSVQDLSELAPQIDGPVQATGRLRQTENGFEIDTDATGPYAINADVRGTLTPAVDVAFDLSVPNLNPLVPQVNGPLDATGTLRQTDRGFVVDTTARGPYGARATVNGLATGPDMALDFDLSLPNVAPVVPGVTGALSANGTVAQSPQGLRVDVNASGPYSARASVNGIVTGDSAAVEYTANVPNLAALVPQLRGPLSVDGTAAQTGQGWRIDTDLSGPVGTNADVSGLVANDGTLDLDVTGSAALGLFSPFVRPRTLSGQADFDLAINGPPALGSVSGTLRTRDATVTAPNLRLALEGVNADVELANSRAVLDVNASPTGGGRLDITGSIGLTGPLPADITVTLDDFILSDPRLYSTELDGTLTITGPVTGGARIAGRIETDDTNISVPSTGLTSIGDIPQITHVGAPQDATATRRRAGLIGQDAGNDPTEGASGPGLALDVTVVAPGRIFVRGRGIDAELGGQLRLTGTTNNIISTGRFELERGRLDILGKRFDLEEGAVTFEGDFIPYIRFRSTTSTEQGTVSVIVEGPADDPEVTFESTPDAPQDQVLAQLLFGQNIENISPFQALQLANAVATLAGRGGVGIVGNLRDNFGLDDLDVTTNADGTTALSFGKYISDNVYTDVTATSEGVGEVSLNLDLTESLTGRATLGSDGDSSIGIFFERDY